MTKLILNQRTLPFCTDCIVAGASWRISTNSSRVLEAAGKWCSPGIRNGTPSFEMEVLVDSVGHSPLSYAHFRGMRHLVFVALPPRSFVVYDLLRRRIHAALSDDSAHDHSFWNNLLLPITIGVLGITIGIVPLHCACLEREGAGLLLAGVSGAGKSTLATALANRGFEFISDDWTYLSKAGSTLTAHGLCSPIKLLPDATRFFPYLQSQTLHTTLNGELAYELDPLHTSGIRAKTISRPQRLFFLERGSAPECNFMICPPGYVKAYFEESAERLPYELSQGKRFRSSIFQCVSACPAWILRTGQGPHETAEGLDRFLREAVHAIT